jgi:RNA polymerase sigma-70 factor, ECF subfamily
MRTITADLGAHQADLEAKGFFDFLADALQRIAKVFLHLAAAQANDMSVLALHAGFVIVLVAVFVEKIEFVDKTRFLEHLERAVNSYAVQLRICLPSPQIEGFGIQVLPALVNEIEQNLALPGEADATLLQRSCHFHGCFPYSHIMDLLATLRERILAFAASRYGRQIAEDIAQEVLLVIHQKYSHVTAIGELIPLAMQITRFKMTAAARKAARRGENHMLDVDETPLEDHQVNLAHELEQKELVDQLQVALPQLGERCRDLFRMKLEGLSFPEMQRILGANSINTVYTWEARCCEELRKLMTRQRRPQ